MPYLFCDNDAFVDNMSESNYNNLHQYLFITLMAGTYRREQR